jgi:hypothetical protein
MPAILSESYVGFCLWMSVFVVFNERNAVDIILKKFKSFNQAQRKKLAPLLVTLQKFFT